MPSGLGHLDQKEQIVEMGSPVCVCVYVPASFMGALPGRVLGCQNLYLLRAKQAVAILNAWQCGPYAHYNRQSLSMSSTGALTQSSLHYSNSLSLESSHKTWTTFPVLSLSILSRSLSSRHATSPECSAICVCVCVCVRACVSVLGFHAPILHHGRYSDFALLWPGDRATYLHGGIDPMLAIREYFRMYQESFEHADLPLHELCLAI